MTNEVKLLPCPFCGGEAAFTRELNAIGCTSCWAEGPCTTPEGITHEWNTRPTIVTDEVVERPTEAMLDAGTKELGRWLGKNPADIDDCVAASVWVVMHRVAAMPTIDQGEGVA